MKDHDHRLAPDDVLRVKVKAELRKRLRGLRKTTPAEACATRSRAIVEHLLRLDAIRTARSVALFWPIEARHEVDLRSLDETLRQRGVIVSYPAIDPETNVMTFKIVSDVASLGEAGYGFAEPPVDAPDARPIDVVVVPAIGVAPDGHRIGYGAGYYDRALPTVSPPALKVVVAYDFQLLAEVPSTPEDVACDVVVTDVRTLDLRAT